MERGKEKQSCSGANSRPHDCELPLNLDCSLTAKCKNVKQQLEEAMKTVKSDQSKEKQHPQKQECKNIVEKLAEATALVSLDNHVLDISNKTEDILIIDSEALNSLAECLSTLEGRATTGNERVEIKLEANKAYLSVSFDTSEHLEEADSATPNLLPEIVDAQSSQRQISKSLQQSIPSFKLKVSPKKDGDCTGELVPFNKRLAIRFPKNRLIQEFPESVCTTEETPQLKIESGQLNECAVAVTKHTCEKKKRKKRRN